MKKKIALNPLEMLELKALGLSDENSSMFWLHINSAAAIIRRAAKSGMPFKPEEEISTEATLFVGSDNIPEEATRAFGFQDILNILPDKINKDQKIGMDKSFKSVTISYTNPHSGRTPFMAVAPTALEAGYNILKLLLKYNHISGRFLIPSAE